MLRHCTMAELLDVRDGQGSSAARTHLEDCAACRTELDRVHQRVAGMRALPSLHPPRDRWPVVRQAVMRARRRTWQWRLVAGGLVAALVITILGVRSIPRQQPVVAGVAAPEIESLVGQSRQLENVLTTVGRDRRVVDGLTASTIAALEDRIAVIDAGIERAHAIHAPPNDLAALWRQRVTLMDALVNVHVRQVGYEGF